MTSARFCSCLLPFVAFALHLAEAATIGIPPRRVSVPDLLRFASIGDPQELTWAGSYRRGEPGEGDPGLFSPDLSHVVVIVRGGDPENETNTAALLLYDTATLTRGGHPVQLARFASAGAYQPIAWVRWLPDNQTLLFAGTEGVRPTQVYRIDIRSPSLQSLTHDDRQLLWYDVSASGKRVVSLFMPATDSPGNEEECKSHGCRVTQGSLVDAQVGAISQMTTGAVYDVETRQTHPLVDPESGDARTHFCDPELAGGLSPDGRYALRMCRFHEQALPAWWFEYRMNPELRECATIHNPRCFRYAMVIDLDRGEPVALTVAPQVPSFWTAPPLWIDGGHRLIIPAALEPLQGVSSDERERRKARYAVQLVDPATRAIVRIGSLGDHIARVKQATWREKTQTLIIQGQDGVGADLPPVAFRRRGARWFALRTAAAIASPSDVPQLVVTQSLNDRPLLVAIDRRTGTRRTILDPNPWLAARQLGRVEAVEWQTASGKTWHGGLYYPPSYQPGRRYPLVLQTHGFQPARFSLSGYARNFPGQALAAHDIIVLQVDENNDDVYSTPKVWEDSRAGYEAAIDHLDRLGLIDRQRVGTIGWSATGPSTAYLFTHSDYPIAAAAFTDTGVWGWWYYLAGGGSAEEDNKFGSVPFGPGLASWLEQSPTFNLSRVRTPLLIWSAKSLVYSWDWYSGLRRLQKPVELWNFAGEGTHDLYRASQRLRMNQLLVDWFCFWLKGEERTEPGAYRGETAALLAEQYTRWRALRKQHEVDIENPRPPLLEWHATTLSPPGHGASVERFAADVAASADEAPSPEDYFLGIRVLKTPGARALKWSVELPKSCAACRLVMNGFTSGQNSREFYFHLLAPPALSRIEGVRVRVDPARVRGVLVGRVHVPFNKTVDGIVFTVARNGSTIAQLSDWYTLPGYAPGDVTDMYTYLETPGVETRIEHALIERRNGPYAKGTWPAVERQAALNLEFATREAITALGLDRTVRERGLGTILLMGFDTNYPTISPGAAHDDNPPHWHMHMSWSEKPIIREIGHFYISPDGLLRENHVGNMITEKSETFGPGQTHTTLTATGEILYTHTITPEGYFVLGTSKASCHLTPSGRGFQTAIDVTCDNGAPARRVRVDDDIAAGRLHLFINDRQVEDHRYDTDNGVLLRDVLEDVNRYSAK